MKKVSISEKAKKVFAALAERLGVVVKKAKETSSAFKKTNDRAIPLTKSILKLSNMFKLMLLRMVMRKVVEAMRQGFQDLAQYSAEFNKTMSQLSTTFLYARNSIATAFAPVLQALTPVIVDITNKFIDVTNVVAAFTSSLFGNAMTFTKAKKAAVDYAKSVAGASKTAKKALASFDEINVLTDNTPGVPEPSEMFEEEEIDATIINITDKVKDMFEDWRTAAQPTIDAVKDLVSALEPLKTFVADGLVSFYERFLKPVGEWVLGEGIPRLVDALKNGLAKIDLTKVGDAFNRLWDALKPFAIKVGEGLVWLWENVLVPLAAWTINELLPAFLDLLTAALDALGAVIDALKPLFQWFWDEFLKPIAEWTGETIIKAIHWLTDALKRFTDWARANPETVRTIATIILGFLAGLWIYNTTKNIIAFLGRLGTSFVTLGEKIGLVGFAVGILAAGIITLAQNWDKLTPAQRAITILSALAAAATAAAIAVALFHTSWTIGIAAAMIAAGIALLAGTLLFKNANKSTLSLSGSGSSMSAASAFASQNFSANPLPKFATGAVIPPNNEFLAVLGDQRSGRNFEAPEGLLRQIVREESGDGSSVPEIKITFNGSLAQLGRILRPVIEVDTKRVGPKYAKGGAY